MFPQGATVGMWSSHWGLSFAMSFALFSLTAGGTVLIFNRMKQELSVLSFILQSLLISDPELSCPAPVISQKTHIFTLRNHFGVELLVISFHSPRSKASLTYNVNKMVVCRKTTTCKRCHEQILQ